LLIQTAYLGDLLLAVPLINELKKTSRQPVELVCRQGFGDIFRHFNLVDKVYEVDKKNPASRRALLSELKDRQFEFVISPHESIRTAVMVSQLKAKTKVGFKNWWNGLVYDCRVERPMHLPDALRQLSLLEPLNPRLESRLAEAGLRFHNRAPLFEKVDLIEP